MSNVTCDGLVVSGRSLKGAKHNKSDDRFLIKPFDSGHVLMAVSDGMGGHPAGDLAAEDVMAGLHSIEHGNENGILSIVSAINRADITIRSRVQRSMILEGMGATVTAAILNRRELWWGHAGDSRLYLMRNGSLRQITKDHSFLQEFVDSGELSEEDAASHPMAHVLDQCVGCLDSGADGGSFNVSSGDFILLCTDGLYRVVSDQEITSALSSSPDVSSCVNRLLSLTTENGLPDDTTIIVAHISGEPGH